MRKLPPTVGAWITADALSRQVLRGNALGRYTVKPRSAFTSLQSVRVVGVPGVAATVAVLGGVVPGLAVAVAPGVEVEVAVVPGVP